MAIEIQNVKKRFGDTEALRGVSVTFESGKIYGLLGNNGAGKSTLMNIISDRLMADGGAVLIDGEPANRESALRKLFLMSADNLYPEDMRVRTAFDWAARFYPSFDRAEADALAQKFELNTKKRICKLSTGYATVFKLILALAVNTPYLLLDEPVLGLDAQHREMFYRLLLEKYAANGCTVVFSTHLIFEAASLVEQVVIIRKGEILKSAATETLTSGAYTVSGPAKAVEAYIEGKTVLSQSGVGGLKTAAVEGQPGELPEGLEVSGLNLQDYFIALMEKEDQK